MILKVYDNVPTDGKFVCKDVITRVKSVMWNRRFYTGGSFQISQTSTNLELLDIVQHGKNSGIVMKIAETYDGCEVYGYDLKSLFKFRYAIEPKTFSGFADEILKSISTEYLLTGDRMIDGLKINNETLGLSESKSITLDGENVCDVLDSFCTENEVGYDILFSDSGMTFKVIKGTDRTSEVTFGRKYKNVDSIEYTRDLLDTYNTILSVSEAEDENGEVITTYACTGNENGIKRREGVDEKPEIETLRGTANDRLKYGTDWDLGDYVTVVHKNLATIKQITEVQEVYEPSNTRIIPVFGTEKENPIKKLLKG